MTWQSVNEKETEELLARLITLTLVGRGSGFKIEKTGFKRTIARISVYPQRPIQAAIFMDRSIADILQAEDIELQGGDFCMENLEDFTAYQESMFRSFSSRPDHS